jgi:hypothetical protein
MECLHNEVSTLRQVVSHLLDSIKSLEAWKSEVTLQLAQRRQGETPDAPATARAGSSVTNNSEVRDSGLVAPMPPAPAVFEFQAIQAAMHREEGLVRERLEAAHSKERMLRAQYRKLRECR